MKPVELEVMATLRAGLFDRISAELTRAYGKHGAEPWGRHEFYAILLEEVDELWEAIKRDEPQERVEAELVQVAAMCFRYFETGDRYRRPQYPHDPLYDADLDPRVGAEREAPDA